MDPTEFTRGKEVHCDSCNQITPSYDIVNYGSMEQGYRQLCSRCFNAEVAKLGGLEEFENLKFESRPPPIRKLHARTGRWVREAPRSTDRSLSPTMDALSPNWFPRVYRL